MSDPLQVNHGLTEAEIRDVVGRCSEENRAWFEAWVRGERGLDGEPVAT